MFQKREGPGRVGARAEAQNNARGEQYNQRKLTPFQAATATIVARLDGKETFDREEVLRDLERSVAQVDRQDRALLAMRRRRARKAAEAVAARDPNIRIAAALELLLQTGSA